MTYMLGNVFFTKQLTKLLSLVFLVTFLSFSFVSLASAQADPVKTIACIPGATMAENQAKCGISQVGNTVKAFMQFIVKAALVIGLILLVKDIFLDFWSTGGGPSFYTNNRKRLTGAFLCLLGLAAAFSLGKIFRDAGVNEVYLKYLDYILSSLPIATAYAAGGPPPLILNSAGQASSWWDIIFDFGRLIWIWLIFPGMIAGWFFAGFKYVSAQGNPEKIKEAHGTSLAVLLMTVFFVFVEAFLQSIKGGL